MTKKKSLSLYPDSGGDLFFIIPRLRVLVPSKHTCTPPLFVVPLSIFSDVGRCCCCCWCCCVARLPDKNPVQILISPGGCKVQMLLCCIKCIEQKHSAGQQLFSKKKKGKGHFLPFFKTNIFKEVLFHASSCSLHPEKRRSNNNGAIRREEEESCQNRRNVWKNRPSFLSLFLSSTPLSCIRDHGFSNVQQWQKKKEE